MTSQTRKLPGLLALSAGLAMIGACASSAPTAVPQSYLTGTPLDRNAIGVVKRTEFLEVALAAEASELSDAERARIRTFVDLYARRGHGPLVLSLPQSSSNPQLAVSAIAEARAIAWERGVEYSEMTGTAHGQGSARSEPLILAFQLYDAVPPNCAQLSSVDLSNIDSNNTLPTLGCSVRTNLAAMIVEPADLLGARALEQGDMLRRQDILAKFRQGLSTPSERSAQESGAVSNAVN
ncbi:CpaD family pilus assembly protein [Hyphomonas sp.]|uniref:CpaD family pilus assembly protein n=1 Tax=Hyphomonas sp. TaxID=87 RepID=UPI00391AEFB3